jgi:acyl-CoA synthetase (AMP-forming)/AMP-acid ligase II
MTQTTSFSGYISRLHAYQATVACDAPDGDGAFNELALHLFALQFAAIPFYARFCRSRGVNPDTVTTWTEIPAVPTVAYKEVDLTVLPEAGRRTVFHSSGTTAQNPSRHYHNEETLRCYESSLRPWFQKHLLPELSSPDRVAPRFHILILTPPPHLAPHSSLVHMFETARRTFAPDHSAYFGTVDSSGAWHLDTGALIDLVAPGGPPGRSPSEPPVLLLGTAFLYVHLLDELTSRNQSLRLPPNSRLLETGGYKGRSRAIPKDTLHRALAAQLGLEHSQIVTEYGMSELSSQAYDKVAGVKGDRLLRFPPWARARVVSPEDGLPVPNGSTGLLQVFDLANVASVLAVQTEDLAVRRDPGFELIGRVEQAEPRGCSLMAALPPE